MGLNPSPPPHIFIDQPPTNRHPIMLRTSIQVFLSLLALPALASAADPDIPWWKQQKMRFMWGQWGYERVDLDIDYWGMDRKRDRHVDIEFPRVLFRDIARAGVTVFVEQMGYRSANAGYCREYGMQYFATRYLITLHELPGRIWVSEEGERPDFKCSLDRDLYEFWICEARNEESIVEGVREGLIDGIQFDWEPYGGRREPGLCYCEDCMARFPGFADAGEELPPPDQRDEWIESHGLTDAFRNHWHRRRLAMFTAIREKLQAVKPDLLFASYDMLINDFSVAMHTRDAPFIVSDAQHYFNDQRQPWWQSYSSVFRDRGYLYLPGAWANGLFGAQASEVSAARWIYETSVNEDGTWVWFERELDDEILRAYSTADREIQAVVGKVGRYLCEGERDPNFVTAVEWTGRPDVPGSILAMAYHFDRDSLVHVNNVHTEWPLRVTLRFPRLEGTGQWTVRDAMNDLTYAHNFGEVLWAAEDLRNGVSVALDPRTDIFLLLAPAGPTSETDSPNVIHSRTFDMLPDHSAQAKGPGPIRDLTGLYRMRNAMYGEALRRLRSESIEKQMRLPAKGWLFRMDDDDIGAKDRWFRADADRSDWVPIEIETMWGEAGGTGVGWYASEIEVPALPVDRQVYLHFEAVDEELVLWLNGEYAGDFNIGTDGWDKPFAIDVTGRLRSGSNHVAFRVNNTAAAGGVWKPVSVLLGPRNVEQPDRDESEESISSSLFVYTATEPMGLRGARGPLSIGNSIRVTDTQGERHERLRQLRAHLWDPQWSPNGEQILFTQDRSGKGQIHVMNADGSDVRNLSDNAFCDRDPSWSPDGRRIAFLSDRTADWDVYVMNADGSGQRRVAGQLGRDAAPAWSPDGRMLAWECHTSGMPEVWVCDANGGNERPVLRPGSNPRCYKWENGTSAELPPIMGNHEVYMTRPVWSPDGTRLAGTGLWKHWMSYIVSVDGSRLDIIEGIQGADNICWSPDGTRLAGSHATAPQETERAGVFVVDASNGETRFVVDVEPTGPRAGGARRWLPQTWYSHGSSEPRRVVKSFSAVAWAPDNRTLAFSSDLDPSGAFYIYTIDATAEGAEPQRLDHTRSVWPQQWMWTP